MAAMESVNSVFLPNPPGIIWDTLGRSVWLAATSPEDVCFSPHCLNLRRCYSSAAVFGVAPDSWFAATASRLSQTSILDVAESAG